MQLNKYERDEQMAERYLVPVPAISKYLLLMHMIIMLHDGWYEIFHGVTFPPVR